MANFLYAGAKTLMLTGAFDWVHDPVVVILIGSGLYVPSIHHATLADVPVVARVATSGVLTGKTVVGNVVDADDYLFTYVDGPVCQGVILAVKQSTDLTSPLICYLDDAVVGIPYTPTQGPVNLVWNDGVYRIFAL